MQIDIDFKLKNHPSNLHAQLNWSSSVTMIRSPSGTGKSTFFEMLAGFGDANAINGKFVLGEEIYFDSQQNIWRKPSARDIAWMPQDFALVPFVEAKYQIFADGHPKLKTVLELLECDAQMLQRAAGDLSLGQQQRIALARAVLSTHRLMLLDEPFHAMDWSLREKARAIVQETVELERRQAIIVSHEVEAAFFDAKELTIDRDGRLYFVS